MAEEAPSSPAAARPAKKKAKRSLPAVKGTTTGGEDAGSIELQHHAGDASAQPRRVAPAAAAAGEEEQQHGLPVGKKQRTAGASKPSQVPAEEAAADTQLQAGEPGSEDPGTEQLDSPPASEDLEADTEEHDEDGGKKRKRVLSAKKLQRLKDAMNKRGVVYVSRIPPHMKPMKLRQLLAQYGEITRVYCAPEDPTLRKQRKKKGGNTGKIFTEGWVEFEDKKVAKRVAAMLNGNQIGGPRRSAYHYDLWCLKYLRGFKWDHLTEEINYQRAVREQRLVQEISAARRERDFYLSRVDHAKAMEAIKERKSRQQQQRGEGEPGQLAGSASGAAAQAPTGTAGAGGEVSGAGGKRSGTMTVRQFHQRRAKPDPVADPSAAALSDDVLGMLMGNPKKKQRT